MTLQEKKAWFNWRRGGLRRALPLRAAVSAILDVGALSVIARPHVSGLGIAAAVGLHCLAALPFLSPRTLRDSHALLALSLVLTLPVVGALLALLVIRIDGTGDAQMFDPPEAPSSPPAPSVDEIRRAVHMLPACTALLSGDSEERRTALSRLARRGDARSLRLLRWALQQNNADLTLEAALALEDISSHSEDRLKKLTRDAENMPSFASAYAAGEAHADAVFSELADPSLAASLIENARGYLKLALQFDPNSPVALEKLARLELAALNPARALGLAKRALDQNRDPRRHGTLETLLRECAQLSRRFDLLPQTTQVTHVIS